MHGRRWLRWLGPAAVMVASQTGCTHEPTAVDVRTALGPEERAALDAVLARAQVDPSDVLGRSALAELFWRGGPSYAGRSRGPDAQDAVDCATRDTRNAIAVEDGHVVGVRLAGTRIDDLRVFTPFTHLVVLDVHDAAIERIEGIGSLRLLDHLDLSGNRLARIEGLGDLPALRSLYLVDDGLQRIEGLEHLAALEVLNLGENRIARVERLDGLDKLKALSLAHNPIMHIEGLDALPELVDLDLSSCKIARLENLGTMPKLRYLDLWHNYVYSLSGIEAAPPSLLYIGLGENLVPLDDPETWRLHDRYFAGGLLTFI